MTADERIARIQEIESELRGIEIRKDALIRELETLRSFESPGEKRE